MTICDGSWVMEFLTILPPKITSNPKITINDNPENNPKNQIFEKIKRLEDIISHKCTKNHDHMLHCS